MHTHHTRIPTSRPRTRLRPHARRTGAAVLFAIGLLLLAAPPATAHDRLLSSTPADGTTVAALPPEIVLTLSEAPLATGAQVAITAADGSMLSTGPASVEEATVTVPVTGQGPAGTYTVAWHVVSSDGHPIEGAFEFALEPAAQTSPSPTAVQTEQSEPTGSAGPESASADSAPSGTQGLAAAADSHDNGRTTDPLVVVTVGIAVAVVILVVVTYVTRRRDHGEPAESGRSTDTPE